MNERLSLVLEVQLGLLSTGEGRPRLSTLVLLIFWAGSFFVVGLSYALYDAKQHP